MKLIPTWRKEFHKLWSIRLSVLSAGFGAAECALPYFDFLNIPPGRMAAIACFVALGSAIARLVDQPKLRAQRGSE